MLQLKRNGNKVLLHGKGMEDAIAVAITAMNEPKTCSITTLRRYLVDSNKYRTENHICESLSAETSPRPLCPSSLCNLRDAHGAHGVIPQNVASLKCKFSLPTAADLKRALTKCKVLGWMQQISGHGFIGTYKLSFPYYPRYSQHF